MLEDLEINLVYISKLRVFIVDRWVIDVINCILRVGLF